MAGASSTAVGGPRRLICGRVGPSSVQILNRSFLCSTDGKGTPTLPWEDAVMRTGGAGESLGCFTASAESRATPEVGAHGR